MNLARPPFVVIIGTEGDEQAAAWHPPAFAPCATMVDIAVEIWNLPIPCLQVLNELLHGGSPNAVSVENCIHDVDTQVVPGHLLVVFDKPTDGLDSHL
jgi:hypothetical protein